MARLKRMLIEGGAANRLVGGAGSCALNAGGGADELWGGTGTDLIVLKTTGDSSSSEKDTIKDFDAGGSAAGAAIDRISAASTRTRRARARTTYSPSLA